MERDDRDTSDLLLELKRSPTDLAKLVKSVSRRRPSVVSISPHAIRRWLDEDPHAWNRVRQWLAQRDIDIVVG